MTSKRKNAEKPVSSRAAQPKKASRARSVKTPRKVLSVEKVGPLILKHNGNLAAVARSFKVSRQAVHDYVNRHSELRAHVQDAKESFTDIAENKLREAVKKGSPWAIKFYLITQGRSRGYILKHKEDGQVDEQLVIELFKQLRDQPAPQHIDD